MTATELASELFRRQGFLVVGWHCGWKPPILGELRPSISSPATLEVVEIPVRIVAHSTVAEFRQQQATKRAMGEPPTSLPPEFQTYYRVEAAH